MKYTRHKPFIIAIGKKIRQERKKHGWSQQKLANLANMELSQINRIELGLINTSVSHVAYICQALEIHPRVIFDIDISKEK